MKVCSSCINLMFKPTIVDDTPFDDVCEICGLVGYVTQLKVDEVTFMNKKYYAYRWDDKRITRIIWMRDGDRCTRDAYDNESIFHCRFCHCALSNTDYITVCEFCDEVTDAKVNLMNETKESLKIKIKISKDRLKRIAKEEMQKRFESSRYQAFITSLENAMENTK